MCVQLCEMPSDGPVSFWIVPAQLKRLLSPEDIRCPAGVNSGDADCYCRIEQTLIQGRVNPDSIAHFCAGDFQQCPTWRADKEATWEAKGRDLLKDGLPE